MYVLPKMLTTKSNFEIIVWVYKTHLTDILPVWGSVQGRKRGGGERRCWWTRRVCWRGTQRLSFREKKRVLVLLLELISM